MSTTIQYKTIHDPAPDRLDKSISLYLEAGWELYGSPYAVTIHGTKEICQAIVKNPTPTPTPEPTHIPPVSRGE